jgi:hypothetical protein
MFSSVPANPLVDNYLKKKSAEIKHRHSERYHRDRNKTSTCVMDDIFIKEKRTSIISLFWETFLTPPLVTIT